MIRRTVLVLAAVAVAVGGIAYAALAASLPDVRVLERRHPGPTAYMRARGQGAVRSTAAGPARWVPLDSISVLAVCAVVKAEDGGYFEHAGVDWARTRSAALAALKGQPATGASTITQQVARNLYLGPERTLRRKLREVLIARELEAHLSKERILEIYLNVAEWGDGAWGVGPASSHYLGSSPRELDAFGGVFLASLLAAPRQPLSGRNLLRARRLQGRVLHQLYLSGLLSDEQWQAAMGSRRVLADLRIRGVPLVDALREARSAPALLIAPPERRFGAPLPPARAVAAGCGHARERRNSAANADPSRG